MAAGGPNSQRIIPLEEGWNEEIKVKVRPSRTIVYVILACNVFVILIYSLLLFFIAGYRQAGKYAQWRS